MNEQMIRIVERCKLKGQSLRGADSAQHGSNATRQPSAEVRQVWREGNEVREWRERADCQVFDFAFTKIEAKQDRSTRLAVLFVLVGESFICIL